MGERLAKLWREIAWSWSPESERESSEAIVRNLWLHWFPAKITRAAMSWNYTLWLGTAAASLFFILTVTGVMLMFFYVPSTERAYGSIKDLQYAVSFGRVLRNQHRWAAEGMVAVVFLHMARVFFTGAYRGTRAANWHRNLRYPENSHRAPGKSRIARTTSSGRFAIRSGPSPAQVR